MKHRESSARHIVATLIGVLSLSALVIGFALLFTSNARGTAPSDARANLDQAAATSDRATKVAREQAEEQAEYSDYATIVADLASDPYSTTKKLYYPPSPDVPADIATEEAESIPVPTGISGLQVDPNKYKMIYSYSDNMWLGTVNGKTVDVLAGLKWDGPGGGFYSHPGQGMVLVETDGEKDEVYLTPSRSGEVKLIAASGTCLTLVTVPDLETIDQTPTGTTFYFDAAKRTWSCSTK